MKKVLSFVLVMLICVSLMVPASASNNEPQLSDSEESAVLTAVQEYFELRRDALARSINSSDYPNIAASLVNDAVLRADTVYDLWENENRYIVDFNCSYEVREIHVDQASGNIEVVAVEYTWFDYNVIGYSYSATSQTAFGTTHSIVLIGNLVDGYVVIGNSYDERDVTGHATTDVIANSATQASIDTALMDMAIEPMVAGMIMNTKGMVDLNACIAYSDEWALREDNSIYGFVDSNDCANFVSQCIAAGGFEYDPIDINERSSSSNIQWWHAEGGVTSTTSCPPAWRRVSYFREYWGARYALVPIEVDPDGEYPLSNVYPGNPVISNDGGHIVLCVGYDERNYPVINGHTHARYHATVSGTSYYGYTILFLTGYCENGSHVTGNYVYNTTGHWRKCNNCGSGATTLVAHTYTLVGDEYVCNVCGYTREMGLIVPLSLYETE